MDHFKVTSEISPFFEKDSQAKPCVDENNVVSKFTFTNTHDDEKVPCTKDEDGDYVLQRKNQTQTFENVIYLEHSISTEISLVGLQIWRAALLMADFVIHYQNLFKSKIILELGSGVGLTSIVAGMFAKEVICTDLDTGNILELIKSNIERNKEIIKADVHVCGLDFCNLEWSSDLKEKMGIVDLILAADVKDVFTEQHPLSFSSPLLTLHRRIFISLIWATIFCLFCVIFMVPPICIKRLWKMMRNNVKKILPFFLILKPQEDEADNNTDDHFLLEPLEGKVIYDNDVTEGFVKTIIKILSLPPKKVLYFALEKRYVFTISDLDSVAPCYEHLMTCLRSEQSKPPFSQWTLTEVPLDFPQYFNYERVQQLVMYKITT